MDVVNPGDPVNQVDQPTHLRLIACPTLVYQLGRIDCHVYPGMTVAQHLREIGWKPNTLNARVTIDDRIIPYAEWEYAVPRAGQAVVIRVIPTGGDQAKGLLRMTGLLAVVALSLASANPGILGIGLSSLGFGGFAASQFGTLGWSVIGALAGIGGYLTVTARMPPARPRLSDSQRAQTREVCA